MSNETWLVRIDFLDHSQCQGPAILIPCTVFGLLYEEHPLAYLVCTWVSDGEVDGMNSETYAILKHEGIKVDRIRAEPVKGITIDWQNVKTIGVTQEELEAARTVSL